MPSEDVIMYCEIAFFLLFVVGGFFLMYNLNQNALADHTRFCKERGFDGSYYDVGFEWVHKDIICFNRTKTYYNGGYHENIIDVHFDRGVE